MKYKRILLKLSGESLAGKEKLGIDAIQLNEYAKDIQECSQLLLIAWQFNQH